MYAATDIGGIAIPSFYCIALPDVIFNNVSYMVIAYTYPDDGEELGWYIAKKNNLISGVEV